MQCAAVTTTSDDIKEPLQAEDCSPLLTKETTNLLPISMLPIDTLCA
jgi:hypothetical protein